MRIKTTTKKQELEQVDLGKEEISNQVNTDLFPTIKEPENPIKVTRNGVFLENGEFKSPNYVPLKRGWKLGSDGSIDAQKIIAGNYIQVFRQAGIPTSLHIGDIWIDTDDNNKYYVAAIIGADQIAAGEWELTNPPASWSTIIDDDGNKPADNADVTSANTAAAIAGQGALATQDDADFSTQVSGATKPDDNATVGATFGTNISGGGSDNTQVSNDGYVELFRQDKFGDGSDGDVTISVDTTLTSDMFYNNLTINNGISLNTGGYRIFVKNTLTNNGTIHRNGNIGSNGTNGSSYNSPGSAGTGGVALADGSLKGSLAGKDGQNGVAGSYLTAQGTANGTTGSSGSTGVDSAKSMVTSNANSGVAGGNGGNAVIFAATGLGRSGGSGGAGGSKTGTIYNKINNLIAAYLLYEFNPSGSFLTTSPSNGGSAVGGSGGAVISNNNGGPNQARSGATGGSGGGGSQGGIVWISAKIIINNGTISANGGNGGNAGETAASYANIQATSNNAAAAGGSGGSGGGDGGNGGVVIILYNSATFNSEIANGGSGGVASVGKSGAIHDPGGSYNPTAANGTNGSNGTTGNSGIIIKLEV